MKMPKKLMTRDERVQAVARRKAAAISRKRWMDRVLKKERTRVAAWMEWYWYNRTYAFTSDHSMPAEDWSAASVEKMMKDLVAAVRAGEALSKNEPVDGWSLRERHAIEFDPETGQGYRTKP